MVPVCELGGRVRLDAPPAIQLPAVPARCPDPLEDGGLCREVIVTGAGGFIGSALVRLLSAHGLTVHAITRRGSDASRLVDVDCRVLEADLTSAHDVAAALDDVDADAVIHSAASSGHPSSDAARAEAWQANLVATTHLLGVMKDRPRTRVLLVGSSTEYSPSERPLDERSPCEPLTVRGASKLAATIAVRQWAREFGRLAAVVRPFSVYGEREASTRLMPTLLHCARSGTAFRMLDGVSRRDLVYVGDVAAACYRALAVTSPEAPIVNIGTGVEHTVEEARRTVEEVTGRPIPVARVRRQPQPHDVEHWVADVTTCRALLGWSPPTSLREGVALLADGWR